ncbi:MAG: HEAT repeat domain-containing protein [Planctomycetota bacterium]
MSEEPIPPQPPPAPEPILDPTRPATPAPEPPRHSFFTVLLQFFLIPVGIVGACAAVFLGLRAIVGDAKSPDELLDEVGSGAVNRRWQAAFELSQVLSQENPPEIGPKFVDGAVAAFLAAEGDDKRIREYLALILGRTRDRRATKPLLEALPGADAQLRVNILLALGEISDPLAKDEFLRALDDAGDAGVRKAALVGLSRLPKEDAILARVRTHLTDPVADVKWNAALVLAALDDPAGADVLFEMLDRALIQKQVMSAEEGGAEKDPAAAILRNAVSASARLYQERFRKPYETLSANDPDPDVRRFAAEALQWLDSRK